jgi:bifunctional non-homologous end joining protein LigD
MKLSKRANKYNWSKKELISKGIIDFIRANIKEGADKLKEYKKKREQGKTPEPFEGGKGKNVFVIQSHKAKKAGHHFDLRLQKGNVLESWAIPRARLPKNKEKLLATQTEPHPLSYAKFEGEIPTGQYGAGKMVIFDKGTYEKIKWASDTIKIKLNGKKEKGTYTLHKTDGKKWIIMVSSDKKEEK